MCGIAGIYRFGRDPLAPGTRERDLASVDGMLRAIRHRGPDDRGIEALGRLTMGVQRLSILDVEGGHQPIADAGRRVWASQNGEIYNYPALREELSKRHPLRTRTDTELLPHLALEDGADLVHRLSGMFALSVFDSRDDSLLLARDAIGVKPLYVARLPDRLIYASEIKAILTVPEVSRELDRAAVSDYLALGFVPGAATALVAIRRVRPGWRLRLTPDGLHEERWWRSPRFFTDAAAAGASADDLTARCADALSRSTRSMLLSDRPLGVLLSGGLDSSVMVSLLPEEVRRATHTFAVGFDGAGYYDERPIARRVAGELGTRHHDLGIGLDVAAELPRVIRHLDEPCADAAMVPAHLIARAAAEHVTVLLSGTGGDEIFGGYSRYRMPRWLRRLRALPAPVARGLAGLLGDLPLDRSSVHGVRLIHARKLFDARGRSGPLAAYLSAFEPAAPSRWAQAIEPGFDPGATPARVLADLGQQWEARPETAEAEAFTFDHAYYLPDDLLLKEDRATMGASIEGRVPYLDAELVALAAGLPLASRFTHPRGKGVLRAIARRSLPAWVADRRKHGFSVPTESWLRGPLDGLLTDVLNGPVSGVFRTDGVRRWHEEHAAGRDRSGPLWAVLAFELWWREVVLAAAPTPASEPAGTPLTLRTGG